MEDRFWVVVATGIVLASTIPARAQTVAAAPTTAILAPTNSAEVRSATRDKPFVNSLGMPFVPIKDTKVLFCIWETRVRDFEAFLKDSGYKWNEEPPFEVTPEHPVINVSWDDANAFCAWLSKKEAKQYRLPSDKEWDAAIGKDKYPWGDDWPPRPKAENISGEESSIGNSDDPAGVLKGYNDGYPRTAPVGRFAVTKAGLYDMGGNVREWVEDWYTQAHYTKNKRDGGYNPDPWRMSEIKKDKKIFRVVRGGAWHSYGPGNYASSVRFPIEPLLQSKTIGFRCALVVMSAF